jgi:peptide-methionine (S)-S-oxide reductase
VSNITSPFLLHQHSFRAIDQIKALNFLLEGEPRVSRVKRKNLMSRIFYTAIFISSLSLTCFSAPVLSNQNDPLMNTNSAIAMFGSGCFWCSEAVFQRIPGVTSVKSGYSGGKTKNPTYKQVCTGDTGHAEVIQISYDPQKVSYENLLDTFWLSHDPTTLNRQGADIGTQYRSVIFYYDDIQKNAAEKSRLSLDKSGKLKAPVVTQIVPAAEFYPAEDYHADYYNKNKSAPYCRFVIAPKLEKLKK